MATGDIRDGIILCLSDETGTSGGEIVSIIGFGSENDG